MTQVRGWDDTPNGEAGIQPTPVLIELPHAFAIQCEENIGLTRLDALSLAHQRERRGSVRALHRGEEERF